MICVGFVLCCLLFVVMAIICLHPRRERVVYRDVRPQPELVRRDPFVLRIDQEE